MTNIGAEANARRREEFVPQTDPQNQQFADGEADPLPYVTIDSFDRFAKNVTDTLVELRRAQGYQAALLGDFFRYRAAAVEQRGTLKGSSAETGEMEKDSALADSGATEKKSEDLWWVVEMEGGNDKSRFYRVKGQEPRYDTRQAAQGMLRIGRHAFAAHSVLSYRAEDGTEYPTHFAPPAVNFESDPEPEVVLASPHGPLTPYNPLTDKLQSMRENAEALETIDVMLGMASISPETRERLRWIVNRGMAAAMPSF